MRWPFLDLVFSTTSTVTTPTTTTVTVVTTVISPTTTTVTSTETTTLTSTTTLMSTFTQLAPTGLSLLCSPKSFQIKGFTLCTATVTSPASTPAGIVSFTSNGAGTFVKLGCVSLSSLICVVGYTPSVTGTQTITANYLGNSYDSPSSGTFQITVTSNTGGNSIGTAHASAPGIAPTFWFAAFGAVLITAVVAPSFPRLVKALGPRIEKPKSSSQSPTSLAWLHGESRTPSGSFSESRTRTNRLLPDSLHSTPVIGRLVASCIFPNRGSPEI